MDVLVAFKVTGNDTVVYVKNVATGAHTQLSADTKAAYSNALDDLVGMVRALTRHSTITCIAGVVEASIDTSDRVTNSPLLPEWIGQNPRADITEELGVTSKTPLRIIEATVSHQGLRSLSRTTRGWMPEALTTAYGLTRL